MLTALIPMLIAAVLALGFALLLVNASYKWVLLVLVLGVGSFYVGLLLGSGV